MEEVEDLAIIPALRLLLDTLEKRLIKHHPDVEVGSAHIVYPWLSCSNWTRCEQECENLCAAQRGLGTVQNSGFGLSSAQALFSTIHSG